MHGQRPRPLVAHARATSLPRDGAAYHATATVVHRSRKVARAGALQLLPPMSVMHYDTPQVTQEHDFMFDLRGYLLLEQAISPELVQSLNAAIDAVPPLEPQQWHGHVHRNDVSKAHCSSPRPRPRAPLNCALLRCATTVSD